MFSIIIPVEENRIPLLTKTLEKYDSLSFYIRYEVLLVSRTIKDLSTLNLPGDIRLINYQLEGDGFSQSNALNIGIQEAIFDNIIVTSPEVIPKTNVLQQLLILPRGNYIAQVFDQNIEGVNYMSLVNKNFRGETPAMHFLGCFKKEDLIKINGWSLDYQRGNGYFNDDDFGDRFMKAGLTFEVRDEIQAIHQYHPRITYNQECSINGEIFARQRASDNFYALNGLKETKRLEE